MPRKRNCQGRQVPDNNWLVMYFLFASRDSGSIPPAQAQLDRIDFTWLKGNLKGHSLKRVYGAPTSFLEVPKS